MTAGRRRIGSATLPAIVLGLIAGLAAGWWTAGARSAAKAPAALGDRMATALRTVDPVEQRRALLETLEAMGPDTADVLFEGFQRESPFADRCTTELVAASWSAFDSEAALDAAMTLDPPLLRSHATAAIAYELGLAGRLDEGQALLGRIELRRVRSPTAAALTEGVVRSGDVEKAMVLLEEKNPSARNRAIESFVRSFLLAGDVDGLIAWVEAIPEDAPRSLKRSAFGLACRWLSSVDPLRAAAWYDAQPAGAPHVGAAHLSVAEEWIERDPAAALAWVEKRSPPEDREADMRRMMKRFTRSDPAAAFEWMERQEPLGWAEAGIPVLVRAIEQDRPADALAWAQRIADASERDRTVERIAKGWLTRDPDAARAWIARSSLPKNVLDALEAKGSAAPGVGATAEGGTSS